MNFFKKIFNFESDPKETEKVLREQIWLSHITKMSLESNSTGIDDMKQYDRNIVISLTTHGRRIYTVHYAIESVMNQTVKPNKILLWLSESEFNEDNLPKILKKYISRGLEIGFVKDLRSFTKLIPAMKSCPDDVIITIDDDIVYSYDMIESLMNGYIQFPNEILFRRGHRILIKNGVVFPYNKWSYNITDCNSTLLNFATGVGGVLYPPNSLDEEVFNYKVFQSICPYADDVWFKAMAILKGTNSRKVITRVENGTDLLEIQEAQTEALRNFNIHKNKNDEQIDAVFTKYKIINMLI